MSNLHFFIDLESVGQSVFMSPIVNWSYTIVDWDRFTSDNPYTFDELLNQMEFTKFDLADQIADGYSFSKRDMQFWLDQPNGKDTLKPTTEDVGVKQAVQKLLSYVEGFGKINRWWSRANCFDPIFLQRSAEQSQIDMDEVNRLIPFWLVRDTRTYIDTRFNFQNKKNAICPFDSQAEWDRVFQQHNSSHDVAADILRIQKIERIIAE